MVYEPRSRASRAPRPENVTAITVRVARNVWTVVNMGPPNPDAFRGAVSYQRGRREFLRRDRPYEESSAIMMMRTAVVLMALGFVGQFDGRDRDLLARFDGGVGVIPVASVAGPANPDGTFPNVKLNIVRGVPPGGGPWRIADLKADVFADGRIRVRGRGLLLASGNSIGQNANQSVFATVICEASAPFVERSTSVAGVPLDEDGNFRIDDVLNPAPAQCASPVLLIRNTGGVWFAAGIPARGDD